MADEVKGTWPMAISPTKSFKSKVLELNYLSREDRAQEKHAEIKLATQQLLFALEGQPF